MKPNRTKTKDQNDDNKRSSEITNDKKAIWAICNLYMKNRRLIHDERERIANYFDFLPRTVTRGCTIAREGLDPDFHSLPETLMSQGHQCSAEQLQTYLKAIPIRQEDYEISAARFHHWVSIETLLSGDHRYTTKVNHRP
jgi:hypothetical protein